MKTFLIGLLLPFAVVANPLEDMTVKELTLDEEIGQLLMVHFHGNNSNQDSDILLQSAHVGAFILYTWANQLGSKEQVKLLINSLNHSNNKISKLPLLIAVDQEGGRVTRLKSGFTLFPSNKEQAMLSIDSLCYETAKIQAQELKSVGINMNLAPVVDINSNEGNQIIGDRSYGNNPNIVISMAAQALKAYKELNILAVLKHYPGHGDVIIDSHAATPISQKKFEELDQLELKPFNHLKDLAPAIMTAHIRFPKIDSKFAASVSPFFITGILKNSWNYQGLIISDSLIMKGLIDSVGSIENAALLALQAGTDILCLGGKLLDETSQNELSTSDVLKIHSFLVKAVKEGKLSESKIDESVSKIIKAKQNYLLSSRTNTFPAYSKEEAILLKNEIDLLIRIHSTDLKTSEIIAKKVWHNETGSNTQKLIHWNQGEDFISLGIGHFIWHPAQSNSVFEEGFPKLLEFAKQEKRDLPGWIEPKSPCPWTTREEYLNEKNSPKVLELQQWLENTMDIQGRYLLSNLVQAVHKILKLEIDLNKKDLLLKSLNALCSSTQGLYALVDYLNFKGSGDVTREAYQGKGWGLKQVLEIISQNPDPVSAESFSKAAKHLLYQRVENSPQKDKEQKWLKGWSNRLDTYLKE